MSKKFPGLLNNSHIVFDQISTQGSLKIEANKRRLYINIFGLALRKIIKQFKSKINLQKKTVRKLTDFILSTKLIGTGELIGSNKVSDLKYSKILVPCRAVVN